MTAREFCYWLQGFFEINEGAALSGALTEKQTALVKQHLALVFKHEIDPSYGDAKVQSVLNQIHSGGGPAPVMRC